jgi:hypothetical protein
MSGALDWNTSSIETVLEGILRCIGLHAEETLLLPETLTSKP